MNRLEPSYSKKESSFSRSKQSISNGRFSELPPKDQQFRTDQIVQIYNQHLYFHGTSAESAQDILENGMQLNRKKSLGNNTLLKTQFGLDDVVAHQYNYVQKTPEEAAEYAKAFSKPAILCLILPPSKFSLKVDPEGDSPTAFLYERHISKKYILPLKKEDLKPHQLKSLNKRLNIPELNSQKMQKLIDRVKDEILVDRTEMIKKAKSYVEQEKDRDAFTKKILQEQGIDLQNLKEGEEISVVFD